MTCPLETAKSETAKLIVLVALEDTETPSPAVSKSVGAKDVRIATADAIKEALGVAPTDGTDAFHIHGAYIQ